MIKTNSNRDIRKKTTLDKDLKKIVRLEEATHTAGLQATKIGLGLLFLLLVWAYAALQAGGIENSAIVIAAGIIGGYMALNIGANDVANNVGPAVGSRTLSLYGALAIAVVFEAAGAIIAGGDVVSTVSKKIIDPGQMPDATTFIWAMMAALLAAALWVNIATFMNTPVSTTHAVVGAVMGGGIAAVGIDAVNWPTMARIAASWVISPVIGGAIAAGFLAFIKFAILYKDDKIAAARRWVPLLVAIMAGVFTTYLVMKGLKRIWKVDLEVALGFGVAGFIAAYALVRPIVARATIGLENRRKPVTGLFTVPLICAAALLSFAHGANDVANAVGPLAAVYSAATTGTIVAKAVVPLWVMFVGALGISAGLVLFGPKLIRTVGDKITRLDRARAFSIALSAAITVILASALGLPVSSTHTALGAVFGVGLLRETLDRWRRLRRSREAEALRHALSDAASNSGEYATEVLAGAEFSERLVEPRKGKKKRKKARARKLVRRQHLYTIIAAWLVTVPLAALLAAGLYMVLRALPFTAS
jgi:PiT family inorganic phosphate transporter